MAARLTGVALFALAACTEMMQPAAPTQPAKAYIGLFKDNAVAVVDTGTNRVLRTHSNSRRTAWSGCYARRT